MNIERSLLALAFASTLACGGDDGNRTTEPMFTSGNADGTAGTTGDETGSGTMTGDGDGDATGDGDPTGDGDGEPACMTDPELVGSSCGQGQAYHGSYDIGAMSDSLPVGGIMTVDNGIGDGAEDWYQFEFPVGERPMGGTAKISFAVNDNNDYRFEIYRDCGQPAYGMGLATDFGEDAPPLDEWTFYDIQSMEEQLEYVDNTAWPSSVWVRVIRFHNDGDCGNYQLQVERLADTP